MLEPAAGCGCLWPDVELSSEPEQEHLLLVTAVSPVSSYLARAAHCYHAQPQL